MNLEQAREIIDTIIRCVRMTREEHSLGISALTLLYDGAKENQESKQAMKDAPKVIPFETKVD